MKIRNGFVSNSSSSSFIVAFKGPQSELDKLPELLGAKPGTHAAHILGQFTEILTSPETKFRNKTDYKKHRWVDDESEFDEQDKEIIALIEDPEWRVYEVSVSNESDDGAQLYMFNEGDRFEVDTNKLKIWFSGC